MPTGRQVAMQTGSGIQCKSERSRRIDSSGIILPKQNDVTGRYDCDVVRGLGFEPRLAGPEPAVLPLDDPRLFTNSCGPLDDPRLFTNSCGPLELVRHTAVRAVGGPPIEYQYFSHRVSRQATRSL